MKKMFFPKTSKTILEDRHPLLNPELSGKSFFWENGDLGVLLLHGLTATTAEIRPLAKRFYREGFTVLGLLLPGHGTTPEELNKTSRDSWIKETEKAYLKLKTKCSEVFIAGESMGSLLALQLASKYHEISGLLLYAPAMRLALSFQKLLLLVLASPFVCSTKKIQDHRGGMPWQGYKVNPLKAGLELIKLQCETESKLHRIYQPILLIQASLDKTVDLKSGEVILKGVQSAIRKSYWMKKSNHVVILDIEFEEVSKISLDFIKKLKR